MEYAAAIAFIEQFASGSYTPADHREFVSWLNSASADETEAVMELALSRCLAFPPSPTADLELVRRIEASLDQYEQESRGERVGARVRRIWRFSAAAILLLLAGAGWWLTSRGPSKQGPETAAAQPKPVIVPGRNAAILMLSGGRRVVLDSATQDTVLTEGAAIVANSHGQLAYNPGSAPATAATYNTLTTARGNQYQLALSDGTKVWLNAASSITYPTAFAGQTREVTITGEAYFEVAQNPAQPFHVKASGLDVAVLGTSFNINTYPDEPASRTTLVEGSIRLTVGSRTALLRPGQQVRVNGDQVELVPNADVEQALAWKNGVVKLTGATIQEVMRQVSRWYDVDVEYQGNLDRAVFVGVVSRRQDLSKLIQVLEATGSVHCIVDQKNKKIIVKR
jgi:transmembrane sensor